MSFPIFSKRSSIDRAARAEIDRERLAGHVQLAAHLGGAVREAAAHVLRRDADLLGDLVARFRQLADDLIAMARQRRLETVAGVARARA